MKGNIIKRDGTDEAQFHVRFKGIERYHEYDSIQEFVKEWEDVSTWMNDEVKIHEKPKSEARRQIDLFLKRIKHIPTDKTGFNTWKANDDIYNKERK